MPGTFYLPSTIKFLGRNRSSFSDARINNVPMNLFWYRTSKNGAAISTGDSVERCFAISNGRQKLQQIQFSHVLIQKRDGYVDCHNICTLLRLINDTEKNRYMYILASH